MIKSLVLVLLLQFVPILCHAAAPRVAVIVSSSQSEPGKAGFNLDELAKAYLSLHDHGVEVVLFSPAGGSLPVHAHKDRYAHMQRFKRATPALAQLAATRPSAQLGQQAFDGVLVIGGDGAARDLPGDVHVMRFLGAMTQAGKPVAAVCHGVAALLDVSGADGKPLLRGKTVSAFSNREEALFGKGGSEADRIETRLRERGADYRQAPAMLPYVAQDAQLITAQNPVSVQLATRRFMQLLGLTLKPELHFPDDASMALVARALASGGAILDTQLHMDKDGHDADWLMLYALYGPSDAYPADMLPHVLALAETIARHFPHPEVFKGLVSHHLRGNDPERARAWLARIASDYPDFPRGTMEENIRLAAAMLAAPPATQ